MPHRSIGTWDGGPCYCCCCATWIDLPAAAFVAVVGVSLALMGRKIRTCLFLLLLLTLSCWVCCCCRCYR